MAEKKKKPGRVGEFAHNTEAHRGKKKLGHKTRPRIRVPNSLVEVMDNPETIQDWDDEELKRGQRRDKGGKFRGHPPRIVPREVHHELARRVLEDFQHEIMNNVVPATKELAAMARGEKEADGDQIKAIQEIIMRFAGKPPERVEIKQNTDPWEEAIAEGLEIERDVAEDNDDDVIDVDAVDEEEDA